MKILITGADVEKKNDAYEVTYQGQVVFASELRDVSMVAAMDAPRLRQLLTEDAPPRMMTLPNR